MSDVCCGSTTVLMAAKRDFRSTSKNGHHQTGPVGPVRAKSRPGRCGAHGARSVTEDRLTVKIGKDRGRIQVDLYARTDVAAGMGIDRDDRLRRDLEIAVDPDDAGIDRAGRSLRERPIEGR